jgi:hypothetical protein
MRGVFEGADAGAGRGSVWGLIVAALVASLASSAWADGRTFHLDSEHGDDTRDGLAPERAWRSIERLNRATEIGPGDRVAFRRGGAWRGSIRPHSGAPGKPVVYGAFGDASAPLPRLLGSDDRSRADDWTETQPGIWATQPVTYRPVGSLVDLTRASWSLHTENGAKAKLETTRAALRIQCEASGTASNHIQLSTAGLDVAEGPDYRLVFRAKASQAMAPESVSLMSAGPPWTSYASARPGDRSKLAFGPEWSEHEIPLHATGSDPKARLTFFLGRAIPAGCVLELADMCLERVECNQAQPLSVDVGNIIFDGGTRTGWKKWSVADLKAVDDYYYDPSTWRVYLRSDGNPATKARSIELALKRHIIDESNVKFVRYENLDLRYGAAHGIGGTGVEGITVSGCDITWIGGSHQTTNAQGKPVRYGNGIEFWSSAKDCLVEHCRIGEIYDAALTNQGSDTNVQQNITYRHNTIWNSEYSFELWDRDQSSRMEHIHFEHNTCLDAGHGWAHAQRPDPNGRHIMLFDSTAQTADVVIRGNIFSRARHSLLRLHGRDWTAALTMDANVWHQPPDEAQGATLLWGDKTLAGSEAESFLHARGFDTHSVFADPRFVDRDQHDLRLAPSSPARGIVGGKDAGAGGG